MAEYYDSSALLSQRDKDGNQPEIYIVSGNRNGGKTFNFSRYLLRQYLQHGRVFGLMCRNIDDIPARADSFAFDVLQKDTKLWGHHIRPVKLARFAYALMMDDDKLPCGYQFALNASQKIRDNSSKFQRIDHYFFDEFQTEDGVYLPKELDKFQSIHTSIARGGNQYVRRVPVYMASNLASKINPYFVGFGLHRMEIGHRRFVRGSGWVLEQTVIKGAAEAQAASGFNRAFSGSKYQQFAQQGQYLLDDSAFIKPRKITRGRNFCILDSPAGTFGIWELYDGIIYISEKYDKQCRIRAATSRMVQTVGNISSDVIVQSKMLDAYNHSLVRFSSAASYAGFMDMFNFAFS